MLTISRSANTFEQNEIDMMLNDVFCFLRTFFFYHYIPVDINECASEPCQNGGDCSHYVNRFACECQQGWTGDFCQTSESH